MIELKYKRKRFHVSSNHVGGEIGVMPDGTLVRLEWTGTTPHVVEEIPAVPIKTHASEGSFTSTSGRRK